MHAQILGGVRFAFGMFDDGRLLVVVGMKLGGGV